jgi:hypothetical protein
MLLSGAGEVRVLVRNSRLYAGASISSRPPQALLVDLAAGETLAADLAD